jgi:toxin ParE1/3/4
VTRYILSPLARVDLNKIWDFTAERWDEDQAEAYLRMIQAAIETIAENPLLCPSIDEVRPGYRRHRAGAHLILFRQIAGAIDVVRVLHEKMDVASHLPDIS